jgi:hypothetical protein
MKAYPVHQLDPQLGSGTYESWLRKVVGPCRSIEWEVDDCGEGGDGATSTPVCVATTAHLDSCREVFVSMIVGNTERGIMGVPGVWAIERSGAAPTVDVDSLRHLASALRRAKELEDELATHPPADIDTAKAIAYVQRIPAHGLDPALANTSLGEWIAGLAGPDAKVEWRLVGCGMTVTPSELQGCHDVWACAEVLAESPSLRFGAALRVGTYKRGVFGDPIVESVFLWDKQANRSQSLGASLAELMRQVEALRKP